MRSLQLRPPEPASLPPPSRHPVTARALRATGIVLIAVGTAVSAAGCACFVVLAAINLLFIALDDSGRTPFQAPVVLLCAAAPGVLVIAGGAFLAGRTASGRIRLAVGFVSAALVLGTGAGAAFLVYQIGGR